MNERLLDSVRRVWQALADVRAGRSDAVRLESRLVDLAGDVCFAGAWVAGVPTNDADGYDSWHARVHSLLGRADRGGLRHAIATGKAADLRRELARVRKSLAPLFDVLERIRERELAAC